MRYAKTLWIGSFNPRAHTGRDPQMSASLKTLYVSIHAPTRGATIPTCNILVMTPSFNPRAHTGRDFIRIFIVINFGRFQSTRPHGARHISVTQSPLDLLFQSTRPHGARPLFTFNFMSWFTFQSTRPHGARHNEVRKDTLDWVSIHAPTRGATVISSYDKQIKAVSIHAPTRGATYDLKTQLGFKYGFNPRAHTGRDTHIVF